MLVLQTTLGLSVNQQGVGSIPVQRSVVENACKVLKISL